MANPLARMFAHVPPDQLFRYLLVGSWNTLFGYGSFAFFTYILTGRIPFPYVAASVIAYFLNVSVAYLGYKFIVFRTSGNYLQEYLQCFSVYGLSTVLGFALLPVVVAGLNFLTGSKPYVPYLAGFLLSAGNIVYGFFAHKNFSFRVRSGRA